MFLLTFLALATGIASLIYFYLAFEKKSTRYLLWAIGCFLLTIVFTNLITKI